MPSGQRRPSTLFRATAGDAAVLPFRLGPVHRGVWLAVVVLSLWLRSGVGIHGIGDAGLDDALFVRLARNMGSGIWLGPVDNTVLVKGAFYSAFTLAAFLAGIPLKLAEQAVYLAAAALIARLVVRSERMRWGGTVLFAALAFNPVLWTADLSRVVREGLYIGLSLAVIALLATVVMPRTTEASPGVRLGRGLVGSLALGLVAGGFWLTREEGVWLVPAGLVVVAIAVLGRLGLRPRRFGSMAASLLLAAVIAGGVVGANMVLNQRFYGVAETVEVNSAAFKHAYGALSRIAPQHWQRYVVFPADARQLAYSVSPAAQELRPTFEGPIGDSWRRASCTQEEMADCTEILASWFQWALRDAVALAGHYSSLPEAARFYTQLAREVDDACDRQAIPCLPPRATLLPPFRPEFVDDTLRAAARLAPEMLRLGGEFVRSEASIGPEDQLDAFEDTVGLVDRRPAPLLAIRGWVGSPAGAPSMTIRARGDGAVRSDLSQAAPDDGVDRGAGLVVRMFHVSTDCDPGRCDLLVAVGDQAPEAVPLADLMAPGRIERPGFTLVVEAANQHFYRRAMDRRGVLIMRVLRPIGRAYAAVTPVLAAVGLFGVLLALVVQRGAAFRSPLFAVVAASAVAIVCRLALIAYLDVTSIRAGGSLYLSSATPFVILLAVGGTLLLVRIVVSAVRPPV